MSSHFPMITMAFSCALIGCGGVEQVAQSVGVLASKHESLHNQMLDCEERYCEMLANATGLDSVKAGQEQMSAEANTYKQLGEEFCAAEGLTTEKLRGILERSQQRQQDINGRIKEQMVRLTDNGTNGLVHFEIPHLLWFKVKSDFFTEAQDAAVGKAGQPVFGSKRHMQAELDAQKERMKARLDEMKAKMGKR